VAGRTFRIGEAARLAGTSADTLRYYERAGVLPKAVRSPSGYREYSDAAIARIRFVRNALRFGFSLRQLASFLRARDAGAAPCHEVRRAGQRILDEMDKQIEELLAARSAVRETLVQWDGRLAQTSTGTPAHLLDMLTGQSAPASLRRSRLQRRGR
jgi:DNA-binding transcriptional MerR regulator